MSRIYRVCRSKWAALDGEGAKRSGGRWNSPGRAIVYMAENVSLAVLENLVHMATQDFPTGYVVVAATIPDGTLIMRSEELMQMFPGFPRQLLGDRWLELGLSAVLSVPSAVVPMERNYLLNPAHPDFTGLEVEPAIPFEFDPRLF